MFQDFDNPTAQGSAEDKLDAVRARMRKVGVDAYLVPRADKHQGEYVPPSQERLKWLTGFSGSAGLAIIGLKKAALFVDGRYTVQARNEVDTGVFELPEFGTSRPAAWIADTLGVRGGVVGFDPWLHTSGQIKTLRDALAGRGIELKPVSRRNLVDAVWGRARPADPKNNVLVHPLKFAGKPSAEKLADVQERLKADAHDAVILTLPDSICWLLNIRGQDIAHNPVVLCFAIVSKRGKVDLFIDLEKLDAQSRAHVKKTAPGLCARCAARPAFGTEA